jgi:hypothetical protein
MIDRALLAALDEAARAGNPEQASSALRGVDPIVRVLARGRLKQVLARARLSTQSEDPVHLARVAFLIAAVGVPGAGFDDVAAIEAEYEQARTRVRAPRRGPWLTLSVLLVAVLAVAAAIVVPIWLRPYDPRREVVGAALSRDLPGFVVALSRRAGPSPDLDRARSGASSPRVRQALGPEAARSLDELLAATETLGTAPRVERSMVDRFHAAASGFDKALAARGLPYFVDTDVLPRGPALSPVLLTFYVEREATVASSDTRVRVVQLWRLDSLNLVQGYLGYTRPSTPAALVLLDQIESDLVQYVLPALPDGEPMSLVDRETELSGEEWVAPLEKWGGELLRKHYAAVPEAQVADARRVGEILARRRALIEKWQRDLAGLGHVLRVPERLVPEADYAEELSLRVPRAELGEWDGLHAELTSDKVLSAFVAFRRGYAKSVERHEVQHRLDYARGLIPVPPTLCEVLGKDDPLDAPEGSLAARSRDELSAYLASVVTAEHTPLLELLLLSRHLFDRGALGGVYWYAALSAFRAIGRELGVDVEGVLGKGPVSRARSAELVRKVLAAPPEELRRAAASVYEKAYAQKVPDVRRLDEKESRPWRH